VEALRGWARSDLFRGRSGGEPQRQASCFEKRYSRWSTHKRFRRSTGGNGTFLEGLWRKKRFHNFSEKGSFVKLLGNLLKSIPEKFFDFFANLFGTRAAVRITAITALASIYLACVVTFTAWIGPLFSALISTSYGFLLGLLFPPIAGSIVAGAMLYRMCVVGVKYTSSLLKIAIKAGPL
jgi:hypothetical protein